MRSGQATIQMKTNVLEIASDESPAVSEYPTCNPANPSNGKVFSLTGLSHVPSVGAHSEAEFWCLGQENAKNKIVLNKLQFNHLHQITQEQAVMRYNEHIKNPRFRLFQNIVLFGGPPAIAVFRGIAVLTLALRWATVTSQP
jgi:hypothetical protein